MPPTTFTLIPRHQTATEPSRTHPGSAQTDSLAAHRSSALCVDDRRYRTHAPPPPRVLNEPPPTRQALSYIVRTTYRMPSPPSTYHLPVAKVEQARGSNNRAGRHSNRGGVHRNQASLSPSPSPSPSRSPRRSRKTRYAYHLRHHPTTPLPRCPAAPLPRCPAAPPRRRAAVPRRRAAVPPCRLAIPLPTPPPCLPPCLPPRLPQATPSGLTDLSEDQCGLHCIPKGYTSKIADCSPDFLEAGDIPTDAAVGIIGWTVISPAAPASRVGGPKAAWLLWPRPWPRLGLLPTTQYSYLTYSCSSNLRLYPFPYPCASTTTRRF